MLPPKIRALLQYESTAAHTESMKEGIANVRSSSNIGRHSMIRQIDEPSPSAAAAIQHILRGRKA